MTKTTLHHIPITRERVARLFRLCPTPAAAGAASARIHELARRRQQEAGRLYALSSAINEHRHALLQGRLGNEAEARKHTAWAWEALSGVLGGAQ